MSNIPNINEMLKLYTKKELWERIQHHIKTIDTLRQQLEEKDKEIAHLKEKDNYHLRYELAGADETITNLRQQLEEKVKQIDIISRDNNSYKYNIDEQKRIIYDFAKQLKEKDNEIERLNAIIWLSQLQVSEKDRLNTSVNINSLPYSQTQLAIQALEKVKSKCDGMYDLWLNSKYKENMYDNEDIAGVFVFFSVFTNDLIKKLKGE